MTSSDKSARLKCMEASGDSFYRTYYSTPPIKNTLKLRSSRIPADQVSLAAFGNRFMQNKKNLYFADAQVYGDARGDQKPETLFFWPDLFCASLPANSCYVVIYYNLGRREGAGVIFHAVASKR